MEIKIEFAGVDTMAKAVELSKTCLLKFADGYIEKLGIKEPISFEEMAKTIIVLDGKKVVGALVLGEVSPQEYKWFEVEESDENPICLQKICIDQKYVDKHIEDFLIKFVKKSFANQNLYADFLTQPFAKMNLEMTFIANGFKRLGRKKKYDEKLDFDFSYNVFKFNV